MQKEPTLKSDTELAIIAFRNRVAEICNADVASEDAVKGDKLSNGLVENAVMLWRGSSAMLRAAHMKNSEETPPILPWLVEHAVSILSRCQKGRDSRTPVDRLHGKDANTRVCAIRRECAGEVDILRTVEQSVAGSETEQCRVPRGDGRGCVQSARG